MFDSLIRDLAARFGLGDKAGPLVQMALQFVTQRETGGLAGFMQLLQSKGLGDVAQSWLGKESGGLPLSPTQVESAFGGSGGLLSAVTSKLGLPAAAATGALGALLPAVIGKLTPGGAIPSVLPSWVGGVLSGGLGATVGASAAAGAVGTAGAAAMARVAGTAGAAGAGATRAAAGGASWLVKLLPLLLIGAGAVFLFNMFGKKAPIEAAPTGAGPAAATVVAAATPAPAPVAVQVAKDAIAEPPPAAKLYFATGKVSLPTAADETLAPIVAYLKDHAQAKATVSGFNDPRGNAAANAELSKNRAKGVREALKAAGIPEDRIQMVKPAALEAGVNLAESRRVEVSIAR